MLIIPYLNFRFEDLAPTFFLMPPLSVSIKELSKILKITYESIAIFHQDTLPQNEQKRT